MNFTPPTLFRRHTHCIHSNAYRYRHFLEAGLPGVITTPNPLIDR